MTSLGPADGEGRDRAAPSGPEPASPSPAGVLGRALVAWGAGHLALGLRRGWLLVAAEVISLAILALVLLPRASGTSAGIAFVALALFFVAWAAQAVDAHRRTPGRERDPALEEGDPARSGSAAMLVLFLIIPATVAVTAFWMVAGRGATPEAALEHYVVAWRAGQPDRAAPFLAETVPADVLATGWREQQDRIASRLRDLGRDRGASGGLDPERPFLSLEFTLVPRDPGADALSAEAAVNVVDREQVRDTFLGLFPTASLRTVVVERIGTVRLTLVTLPAPLGIGPEDSAWRISDVSILP